MQRSVAVCPRRTKKNVADYRKVLGRMDFWRIYRLVFAKRWLVAAMILIAGAVIFLGTTLQAQKKEYQSEARLQPQGASLADVIAQTNPNPNGASAAANNATDNAANVSDLIMMLRSNNDLYLKTAALLRENEEQRVKDVQQILERNGFFASIDTNIEEQAAKLEADGSLSAATVPKWIKDNRKAARDRQAGLLAKGHDDGGAFAAGGVKLSEGETADRIRQHLVFDTVLGPLSTDTNTQIVNQINVTGKFEREAEANLYVNLVCIAFIDYYSNQRSSQINARIALLKAKLAETTAHLAKARAAEISYRKGIGVPLTSASDSALAQAAQIESAMNLAEQDVRESEAAVTAYQAAVNSARSSRTVNLPTEENPEVRRLRTRVSDAQLAFDAVRNSNEGIQSEKYKAAQREQEAAQSELQAALKRPYTATTVSQAPDDLQARLTQALARRDGATKKLSTLQTQFQAKQALLANLPAAQSRLHELQLDTARTEAEKSKFESTLNAESMAAIREGGAGAISIVSQAHATPVVSGIATQRGKLMVYGMVLALVFGIAMVVGLDALDNSVHTVKDVEALTGLPIAGVIPEHLPDPVRAPRIALLEPMSPIAETYRLLRTDLLFTSYDKPFQSLMMATGKPGQGSTTTISNLAIVMAQAGKTVILVDADMRYPKLHRVFNTPNDRGLASVLANECAIEEALAPTEVPGLTLLPAGPIPENPSELLIMDRMKLLHEKLKGMADFVLFDTPSAIAFSDSAIMASFVDATLMVVRSSNVPRGSEDQVRKLLTKARANIIGVVLNGVPAEQVDSVHYHYAYYPVLPAPQVSGNGNNGYRNGHSDDPLPLALPGGEAETPEAVRAAARRSAGVEASQQTAPRPVYADPAASRAANLPASSYLDSPRHRLGKRGAITWKSVLVVVVIGLVLGGAVLLLGSGTGVK